MPYPSRGGGGGAGFQLFIQSDNNQGIYADAAARNTYFAANQSEVDRLARNEFLIIRLDDNSSGDVAYQQYTGAEGSYVPADWVDVTSLVQGDRGLPGDAATVANLSPRTAPIKSATEEELVDSLMTQPSEDIVVVDGEIGTTRTTLRIGDNLTLGEDGAAAILSDMIDDIRALPAGTLVNPDGSTGLNAVIRRDQLQSQVLQPADNETQVGDWIAWVPVTDDRIVKSIRVRFAQAATGVRFTIRQADNQTQTDGPVLYRSHTDTIWNSGGGFSVTTSPEGGPSTYEVVLENAAKVLQGKFVYLVVEQNTQGTGDIEFRGATLNIAGVTQFYAYLDQTFLIETRDEIALAEDIAHPVTLRRDMPTAEQSLSLVNASLNNNSALWKVSADQLTSSNRSDATIFALQSGLLDVDGNEIPTTSTAANTIQLRGGSDVRIFGQDDFRVVDAPIIESDITEEIVFVFDDLTINNANLNTYNRKTLVCNLTGTSKTITIAQNTNIDYFDVFVGESTPLLVETQGLERINDEIDKRFTANQGGRIKKMTASGQYGIVYDSSNDLASGGITPADADRIYYGLSQSDDTTTIDFATLTREDNPTDPDTLSTGTTSSGDYFVVFVPMTHDITSIFDTVLQQDVTTIFTSLDNAQVADTISFKSYIIGPLNADVNEQYVINF